MSKICRSLNQDFIMFEKALLANIEKYNEVPTREYTPVKGLGNEFKCKAFVVKKILL